MIAFLHSLEPSYLIAAFVFVFGCCIGSFLNVCIWRLPRGKSISKPVTSICPECNYKIQGYDNIPILSYILLLGRCRNCKTNISVRYPIVEALTGILFFTTYYVKVMHDTMCPGELITVLLLISILVVASGIDMEFFIIPDELTVYGIFGGMLAGLLLPSMHTGNASWHTFETTSALNGLWASILGTIAGGGFVLFFAILGSLAFRREAIGLGDVKLMAMIGSFLGWRLAISAFALAPFIGLLYGLPMLLKNKSQAMPFGPFLSGGAILAIWFRPVVSVFFNQYVETIHLIWGII